MKLYKLKYFETAATFYNNKRSYKYSIDVEGRNEG